VSEHGVATVSAAMVIAGIVGLAMALLQVAVVVAAKHRAESTTDLAAIAGSAAALRGRDACRAAGDLAARSDVQLTSCRVDLAVVTVAARTSPIRVLGVPWRASARARAAPSYYVTRFHG
jgi:secretion/DNA translocation related TadE-like protein